MSFRGNPRNVDELVAYILEQLRTTQQAIYVAPPLAYGTPFVTLAETAGAGSVDQAIRVDAQIALFENSVSSTQAFGDAATKGSAAKAARRDHKHGMPAAPVLGVAVQDEGVPLGQATSVNFVGAGVVATFAAGLATVTIAGGGGGGSATFLGVKKWGLT